MQELAGLLRQLRRREARQQGETPLTYRQLAAKTGWSRGVIGEYFGGNILPPPERFDTLIRLLGPAPPSRARWPPRGTGSRNAAGTPTRTPAAGGPAADRPGQVRRHPGRHVAARLPVPRQLPPALPGFVGRAAQLAQLDAGCAGHGTPGGAESTTTMTLSGTAGVGKTALAVHWAHRVADRFPDGQLYVNLRGFDPTGPPVDPAEASARVPATRSACRRSGSRPTWTRRSACYRSLLAGRRMLVLLDNARDAEQVRPLLPGAPGCLVLVTSRDQLAGLVAAEGARPIAAGPAHRRRGPASCWPAGSAPAGSTANRRRWTRSSSGAPGCRWRWPSSPPAAAAHPAFPLPPSPPSCATAPGGLDAFDGGDPAPTCGRCFSWSYRHLSPGGGAAVPAARRCTRGRTSARRGGQPGRPAAAARCAGCWPSWPARHLVAEHAPGRYAFHDLLRAYAAELAARLDTDDGAAAAVRRGCSTTTCTPRTRPRCCCSPGGTRSALPRPARGHARGARPTTPRRWPGSPPSTRCCWRRSSTRPRPGSTATPGSWPGPWRTSSNAGGTGTTWPPPSRTALAAAQRAGDRVGQATPTATSPGRSAGWAGWTRRCAHYRQALDPVRRVR